MSIKQDLKQAGLDALGDMSDAAFQRLLDAASAHCRRYLYHHRMIAMLERKAKRHKVAALNARLRWHRFWRRKAQARCQASNECPELFEQGCGQD